MADDSVKLSLEVATQAAEIALDKLNKKTQENDSVWNIFKGNLAAGIALDALRGSFDALSGFVSAAVGEAQAAEQSITNMNVALQNAGLYSKKTSEDFQAYADQLELTTAFSGEAAEGAITLFASLTTLSKEGIVQATDASADLAATLNVDLATASDMIAKAVNGNTTAFKKLGIEIQKGDTDSERLANTLEALSRQQGAAAATSQTFAGATAKLENQKGKLFEAIGGLITQNPIVIAGMETLTAIFGSLATFVDENSRTIIDLAKAMLYSTGIVATAGAVWLTYTAITGGASIALGVLAKSAAVAWAAVTGPVGLVVAAIVGVGLAVYGVIKYWDDIKIVTLEAAAAVLDYAAIAAGVFSNGAEKAIESQANALRAKAQAVREVQKAEQEAQAAEQNRSSDEDLKNEAARMAKEKEELAKANAEKVASRIAFNEQMALQDDEFRLRQQEAEFEHQQVMNDLSDTYDADAVTKKIAKEEQLLLARQQFEMDSLNATLEAERQKALIIEDASSREKALRENAQKADLERTKLTNKQQIDLLKQRNSAEEQLEKQKQNNKKETWSTLLTLQNSSNKELAAAGKAFAIYDIAVNTPIAISKALAAYPPPFNFAAAALVGAAMASQAAQVAGLNFATGGIVPGASYSGDKVAANVNSREMILTTQQQAELFRIANGKNSLGGDVTNGLLVELIDAVKSAQSITINGKEIMAVVRDGLNSGRTFA